MTIEEFGKVNGLSKEVLKEVFGIAVKEDLRKDHWGRAGIPKEEVTCKGDERRGFTRGVCIKELGAHTY